MIVDRRRANFERFNENGGKFRLSITGACNLRCFFCHNEGMGPVRTLGSPEPGGLGIDDFIAIADAYARLGGRQINITGGEPLAHPELPRLLESIEKRDARLVLNSNGLLYERLTRRSRIAAVDCILVSLHTVDNEVFRRDLAGRDIAAVQRGILALRDHGYPVKINLSLGPHNAAGVEDVVRWAAESGVDLKIIALVRPTDDAGFYHGEWVDPAALEGVLARYGTRMETREQLGGSITAYRMKRSLLEVKNIARGRLRTDFCDGCAHADRCGEGIYGLRIGVDGFVKPCLLRRERYRAADRARPWEEQILDSIDAMMGMWNHAYFATGAPL